jgi:hypothetical protein
MLSPQEIDYFALVDFVLICGCIPPRSFLDYLLYKHSIIALINSALPYPA